MPYSSRHSARAHRLASASAIALLAASAVSTVVVATATANANGMVTWVAGEVTEDSVHTLTFDYPMSRRTL
ncbi:MAG: hypothetical protein SPI77_07375 [Corynebacterium sp.]|nr:hypothetical protein [Corynebacterium sp.]